MGVVLKGKPYNVISISDSLPQAVAPPQPVPAEPQRVEFCPDEPLELEALELGAIPGAPVSLIQTPTPGYCIHAAFRREAPCQVSIARLGDMDQEEEKYNIRNTFIQLP